MDNVYNFIKSLNINSEEYIVIACSGGPDSMLLLDVLSKYFKNIVVAHVNHKLRSESDEEYLFLKKYCEDNNYIFEGTEINEYEKGNVENYARKFRYNYFSSIIKKYNSKYLFTAHHGDDLIETIMMRITRGSSLKGYSGFQKVSSRDGYNLIRPLIYLSKSDINEYNKDNNIPYVIDKTNDEDNYTRNRFRHNVLPFLHEEEDKIIERFILFSEELKLNSDYIEQLAIKYYQDMFLNHELDIDKFTNLDEYMQKYLIRYELKLLYPDNLYLVDNNNINEVIKIIKSDKPNIKMQLPNNIMVIKEYNVLKFCSYNLETKDYSYTLDEYLSLDLGELKIVSDTKDKSNYTIRLNSKNIKLPLIVRNRKNGDKMVIKNSKFTKKINDIFIDSKISKGNRELWPIVLDSNNEILWVPGLKKSNFDVPIEGEYDIIITYAKKEK